MIRIPNSLTFRLTLWYASAFVLFMGSTLFILYASISSTLSHRMDEDLIQDIVEFRSLLETSGLDRVVEEIKLEDNFGENDSVFLRILNNKGNPLFTSDLSQWDGLVTNQEIIKQLLTDTFEPILVTHKFSSQEYKTRIVYGRIGPNSILHVGESLESKQEIMELLFSAFIVMFFLVVPVASGVGWLVAKRASRGINEVSRAATDIEKGELSRRVDVDNRHSDEIQNLASTFNSMADQIRSLIHEMREMTDNIAHDLRSPLARIRAISEVALSKPHTSAEYQTVASDTLEECDRLIKLINTTLDVAEAEAGVGVDVDVEEEIDVSNLTEDACELFEPVAEEKSINLTCKLEQECRTLGNKQNLQRMLANILDNAIKYTPAKGEVVVNLSRDDDKINIAVTDSGQGIPLTDQHRVFERFFRCDQSRSKDGCGLGLSFSRAIARAHGGDITVNSVPLQSSTFTITLPTNHSLS